MIYESSQVSFREIQILVKIWVNTRGALDSGGHEGDLWIRVDMGLWVQVIVEGSLGFKQPRSAALDSGGHEGALGAGKLKRAIWIWVNAKGRFGLGQRKRVPWMQAIAKARFGFGRTRETLWVHTSLKGCFGYGQVKKSVLGMGKR